MLGLSAEYQAFGRWFVTSGDSDFRSYLASYCPHLYSDFRADFASGSSRFLAALSSASLPLPSSVSSVSSFSASGGSGSCLFFSCSFCSSFSLPCSFAALSLFFCSSSGPSVSSAASLSLPDWRAVPGLSAVPFSLLVPPPSLSRLFAVDPAPSVPVPVAPLSSAFPSAPSAPDLVPGPSFSYAPPAFPAAASSSSSFVALDELPEDAAPDALPRDADSAVPESVRSEFRRMLSFLVDFFRRLRLLLLLLLLLGLCSRISLAPLFQPLLLSTSHGSRGSARLWLMRMLALLLFVLLGVLTFCLLRLMWRASCLIPRPLR